MLLSAFHDEATAVHGDFIFFQGDFKGAGLRLGQPHKPLHPFTLGQDSSGGNMTMIRASP
jgi:hypothetical protein